MYYLRKNFSFSFDTSFVFPKYKHNWIIWWHIHSMNLPQYPQAFLQFVSMCSTYSWSQYPKRFHSLQTESRSTLIHSKRDYIKNYLSARTKDLKHTYFQRRYLSEWKIVLPSHWNQLLDVPFALRATVEHSPLVGLHHL